MHDDPIIFSWSELDAGRQCPHKHELSYKHRWNPPTTSRPLDTGKLWHAVLETHYRSLQQGAPLPIAKEEARSVLLASGSDYIRTIEWMYERYVERWGADRQIRILGVEHELLIPLDDRVILKVKLDLVVFDRERQLKEIWDHKKSGRWPLRDKNLAFMDQFGLYEAALNRSGKPVIRCMYNLARAPQQDRIPVKDMDPPLEQWFDRQPLYRTAEEQETIIEEALDDIYRLHSYKLGKAPRHPDEERCDWRCPFTRACLHGRKHGRDKEADMLEVLGFEMQQERH